MKSKWAVAVALVLVHAMFAPAWGQGSKDWVEVRGANELRALVSGKSFADGWGSVRAFRADGKGLFMMSTGARIRNAWTVKGNEKICATPKKGDAECWSVRRSRRDQHMVSFLFDNGVNIAYQVKDGVPDF